MSPSRLRLVLAVGSLLVAVAGGPIASTSAADPAVASTFLQEATFSGGAPRGYFGENVALSADGNVALVGAQDADGLRGAVWIYRRGSQGWSSVKLPGPKSSLRFGGSVALSADGRIALIGAPGTDGGHLSGPGKGAAWTYNIGGGGGVYVGTRLPVTGVKGKAGFGSRVALSANGRIAVVGAYNDDDGRGAAWVFYRTGPAWLKPVKLTPPSDAGKARYGTGAAVSADGKRIVIGAPGARGGKGAVWLWNTAPPCCVSAHRVGGAIRSYAPSGQVGAGWFGFSVAVSADGETFVVGAPYDDSRRGAAWTFARSPGGTRYFQVGPKLTPRDARGKAQFGVAVALSADGSSALIGGSTDDGDKGAAWLFAGEVKALALAQIGPKLTRGNSRFGASIAISPEGNRVLIGGPYASARSGAAWLFVDRPVVEAVRPDLGPTGGGTGVMIVGSGFAGVRSVTFGTTPATSFSVVSRTRITAVAPAHFPEKVAVKVTTNLGTSGVQLAGYTYLRAPFVSMVTPGSGPPSGGTQVTITGLDFIGVTRVTFSDRAAAFKVNSATEIVAEAPPGMGTVPVFVTTPGGTSARSDAARFTYENPPAIPSLTSISPASGPVAGGTQVTITGSDLGGATTVMFGSAAAASFTVDSATQIRAVSPAGQIGTVDITVTTPGGTTAITAADRFTYYTVIDFDGRVTGGPGESLTTVSNQYAALGVTFNGVSAINYSKGSSALPAFAHSGTSGVESCVGQEFCTKPIAAAFVDPQRTVCAWVGFSFPLNQSLPVELRTFNAASQVVGTASATLPARATATPIRMPLQVALGSSTITALQVLVPGGFNGALAVDDVMFTTGPGPLSGCQ